MSDSLAKENQLLRQQLQDLSGAYELQHAQIGALHTVMEIHTMPHLVDNPYMPVVQQCHRKYIADMAAFSKLQADFSELHAWFGKLQYRGVASLTCKPFGKGLTWV